MTKVPIIKKPVTFFGAIANEHKVNNSTKSVTEGPAEYVKCVQS